MPTPSKKLQLGILEVRGDVKVKKLEPGDRWGYCTRVIIMGPTGAGKSSFVEALAGPNASVRNLSSGQLEGYTQEVSAYMVRGLGEKREDGNAIKISLIDTPGFADDKISTLEVVAKVQAFLKENQSWTVIGSGNIPHILFFTPINCIRLSASQRKVINTFKELTGRKAGGGVTIVTTMWDMVWGYQAQIRAQNNFRQLKNEVWKEFLDKKSRITRFYNTQASAIQILDLALQRTRQVGFNIENAIRWSTKPSKTKFGVDMYTDLVQRIIGLHLRKANIHSTLADLESEEDMELIRVLESELGEVNPILTKFEKQLLDFGPPPPTLQIPPYVPRPPAPVPLLLSDKNPSSNGNLAAWLKTGALAMRIKRLVKDRTQRDGD